MDLDGSVSQLKNIGSKRLEALSAMGIDTVAGLIGYYPRDYLDRSETTPYDALLPGQIAAVEGSVLSEPQVLHLGAKTLTKFPVGRDGQSLDIVFFNQPYLKKLFAPGKSFIFCGRITERGGRTAMESPDYESAEVSERLSTGRIVPVYRGVAPFSQKMFRALVKEALDRAGNLSDALPESLRAELGLCSMGYAAFNMHFPVSGESYFAARKRLVFEELLVMQLALLMFKGRVTGAGGNLPEDMDISPFLTALPFALTAAQERVLAELSCDLKSGRCMNRLIQGDVGSGKTAVAMAAVYLMAKNGFQSAVMAPTETLAVQHYHSFSAILAPLDISCAILSGSMKPREKAATKRTLVQGDISVIIGTHALIQDNVAFARLGLVITDEQHRFGVRQRATLAGKGTTPHALVMSATPIPRTLALILYGDMDVSIIDELPPGRQNIDTFAVGSSYRERIWDFVRKQVEAGRQAYIICPLVEESDKLRLKDVMGYTESLRSGALSELKVSYLHGRLKAELKNVIMADFAAGAIDVLVSTTVVEVGVNVPNATVMVVENAERFGLSQLHQLRGRVGRGTEKSYCVLITDSKNQTTRERAKAMAATNDGFLLSELDLELRGPGEFFGTMQHGIPELRLANLYKDMDILKIAQRTALDLFDDPERLESHEAALLRYAAERHLDAAGRVAL